MNILNAIKERSVFFYFYLVVFGIVNSAMATTLLFFINTKLIGESLPFLDAYDFELFLLMIALSFIVSYSFELHMVKLTEKIGVDMKKQIFNYLRFSDYENFIQLKEERVRTALFDVTVLQELPLNYVAVLNSVILVTMGVVYLLVTNLVPALALLFFVGLTIGYFVFSLKSIKKEKNLIRNLADDFMRFLDDFLKGFRELKMNSKRNENIFSNYLIDNLMNQMSAMLRFVAKFIKHRLLSKYAVYIIIGFILFILPGIGSFDTKTMTVFVTTFLFIAGPIADLINRVDAITTINISINRLNQVEAILKAGTPANRNAEAIPALKEPFESIRFEDIVFEYKNRDQASAFKLGQLNITFKRGELVFIIGGNGSGKSTFINLLSGLYKPIEGKIFYNNQELTAESYSTYRDQISCVFTDNYLFSENYDKFDFTENNHYFKELIHQMELDGIATVDSEKNKVKTTLSKGQQKRLALIFTMLEDCEILIFDEWAAEQDPIFRKYFYRTILPQLQEQGKTVIAITHDDAYFDCADRIIKFEYGQIVKEVNKEEALPLPKLNKLLS